MRRLIHNWISPYDSLDKQTTPAMAMGFCKRPVTMVKFCLILLAQPGNRDKGFQEFCQPIKAAVFAALKKLQLPSVSQSQTNLDASCQLYDNSVYTENNSVV